MAEMLRVVTKNDFTTDTFLKKALKLDAITILRVYGEAGVRALEQATPIRTGLTASSWGYIIESTKSGYVLTWTNSNINDGVNIALILQTGHGTNNGGYVTGIDYINPALTPIFDAIADDAWREVTSL